VQHWSTAEDSSKGMLIHLLAHSNPFIGFGNHALNLCQQLKLLTAGAKIELIITDPYNRESLENSLKNLKSIGNQKSIVNVMLGDGKTSHQFLNLFPGEKATYTVFESDLLPIGWKENLEQSELILTASQWGAEIIRREVPGKSIEIVPEGVDISLYHQWNRPTDSKPWSRNSQSTDPFEHCFNFLSIGKFEARKSFEELIEAYATNFAEKPDTRLLLRLHNVFRDGYMDEVNRLIPAELRNQILIIKGSKNGSMLSPEQMAHLHRISHCFVYPSKGEGWGLPLIEAISSGTPFLATHYSGQTEYLRYCQQSFSQIKFDVKTIADTEFFKFHRFKPAAMPCWAMPQVRSIGENMKSIYENWQAIRQQAKTNADAIHRNFSWNISAKIFLDKILDHFQLTNY
jgi:glycosyltransferase involved in cell wall biosynthesis